MRPAVRDLVALSVVVVVVVVASVIVAGVGASAAAGDEPGAGPSAIAVVRCDLPTPTVEVTYSNRTTGAVEFATTVEGAVVPDPAVGGASAALLVASGASTVMDYPLAAGSTVITIDAAGRSSSATFDPNTTCGVSVGFDLAPPPLLRRFGPW